MKSIFIIGELNKEKISRALEFDANAVFSGHQKLREDLVAQLRSENVKVYAEVGLFAGEGLWGKYPDCRPVDRRGHLAPKVDWYGGVCPNHPQVRKEKLQLVKSIIDGLSIDGIWLDFIRYPCHWEVPRPNLAEYCFCPSCLERFKQEVGGEPKGPKWIQWKCDQITNFVADTRSLINQVGKDVQLGMFSVPWREKDFDGAIRKIIGQDFASLSKYIDVFSPMVYHQMCGRSTAWIHGVVVYMNKVTRKPILPIVQTEDKPAKISKKEFKEEITQALKPPSQGVIVFFLEDLLKDENKTAVIKELLPKALES